MDMWCHKHDGYHVQNLDGGTHLLVSSDNSSDVEFIHAANPVVVAELLRGYRREAVLAAMLREWAEEATLTTAVCGKCGGVSGSIAHYKCLVARTEALLGETE